MKACIPACALVLMFSGAVATAAAQPPPAPSPAEAPQPPREAPSDYVIGSDDVVGVLFWRDEAMSIDATVRPDGKITLPMLNDVQAAGFTPEQLRAQIAERAKEFIDAPNVTVVVRQMNSRKVFITGEVTRPGSYVVNTPVTVLQLIALAGGVSEFAKTKEITVIRPGEVRPMLFNYDEVRRGRHFEQNIVLKPGDTVIVP